GYQRSKLTDFCCVSIQPGIDHHRLFLIMSCVEVAVNTPEIQLLPVLLVMQVSVYSFGIHPDWKEFHVTATTSRIKGIVSGVVQCRKGIPIDGGDVLEIVSVNITSTGPCLLHIVR